MTTTPPRAQIGIGTLVVFVTMMLVASIAAGVLLNTVDITPRESETPGEAPAGLVVVGQSGTVQDGGVGLINLTVSRGSGTDAVDLRKTTITWVGPDGAYNVAHDRAAGASSDATFHVTARSDPNDSGPVLDSHDDRMVLTVDLGPTDDFPAVDEFGERLGPGDQASLVLTTGDGTSTRVRLAAPRSLAGKQAVVL